MPVIEHLEDQYLATRQATDLWQSAQLNGETVKLEANVPSKEPKPDVPGGTRSNEEIDAILAKQKTVESPEVQAVRQQFKEHTSKLFSGETAIEEVGKAGRKLAEAVAPGIELAGRAIGLDETGAAALSQGMVEFLAGLPGKDESDLHAGFETALAALPMVGMAVKGGKVVGKAVVKEFEKAAQSAGGTFQIDPVKMKEVQDRLAAIPEIQQAKEQLKTAPPPVKFLDDAGNVLPDRAKIHEQILSKLLNPKAAVPAGKTPKAVIVIGPPASGKTEVVGPMIKGEFTRLDADAAKQGLPEFDRILAQRTQDESSHIVEKELLPKALAQRHNLVLDMVGRTPEKMLELAKELKRAGYSIQLYGIKADPLASAERATKRFLRGGRYVDDEYILKGVAHHPDESYTRLRDSGLIDEWRQYENPGTEAPRGSQAKGFKVTDSGGGQVRGRSAQSAQGAQRSGSTRQVETPVSWDEAVQIDEYYKDFDERLKTFSDRLSKQRRGVRSDVQVTADSISHDALTMESFLNLTPGTILKDSDVVAAKRMFKDLAEPVRQLAQWMQTNPGDQKAFLGLLEQLPKVDQGVTSIAGAYAESGRTQRLLSKDRPTGGMIPSDSAERVRISDPYIQQWLEFFKEQDSLAKTGAPALTQDKLIQALASMKTPEEFIAAAKVLARPSKWDMFIEYWINGLLSGPATHATNMLSNAATIAWGIPERQLAAMYSKEVRPSEAGAMLYGILEAQGDAFRLAWKAFKAEESQMGAGKLEGPTRAITADALALTGVPGRAVDLLGSMIRLPGRALLASDDYFKSIAYRAELRALAKRESFKAVTEGGLTGQTARTRMREIEERILASPPDAIDEAAKEFASYVTFTRELGETGQKVQQLASTPVGRLVLPFVRTPTNIFKYAGERTPLAFASQAVRDEIAAGGQRRALALAKISLGAMTLGVFGMLSAQGFLTGGGPKDKALRAEMMMTGWQPYSFKIGDTYYKYSRIEPIGSLFGMAADAADVLGQLPEKDAEQLAASLVVAISRNVAQKTFIKGIAGTLNAVASQDLNVVKAFLEQELPTILPYSTAEGQVARALDPVMRETNSILDAYKAKIPGLSSTLPPRRNLWGEAIMLEGGLGPDLISPIYTTTKKLDPVAQELARLEVPVGMPSKNIEGVPLTGPSGPQEYDAYVVLSGGKPIMGDMTLKQRLAELMQSDLYKHSSDGKDGGKKVLIQSWVSRYRDMARYILSDPERSHEYGYDFPDLRNKIQDKRDAQAQQFQAVP